MIGKISPSWRRWLGIGLSLVLLYLIVDYLAANPELFDALKHLSLWHLIIAIALHVFAIALQAYRTRFVLTRFVERPISYWHWLRVYAMGQTLNYVAFQAGDLYRAHMAKRHGGARYSHYASTMLLVAWIDVGLTLVAGVLLHELMPAGENVTSKLDSTPLMLAALAWIAVAPVGTVILRLLSRFTPLPASWIEQIDHLLSGFWQAARQPSLLVPLFILGLISFSNLSLLIVVVFDGLGTELLLFQAALLLTAYRLGQAIAITPGNLGIREWSVAGMCVLLGVDVGLGILMVLVVRGVHFAALGVIGAAALADNGVQRLRARFST